MTENELIIKAQEGDLNAETEILAEYSPLVRSIARSFFVIGEDNDDLVQMGMLGLLRAIRTFSASSDSGAAFKTYASHCIRNSILDSVRKAKNRPTDNADFDELELFSKNSEPETIVLEGEAKELLTASIASVLNERETSVLNLFLDALSYQEISEKLGIEKKQVDNTIYSLRKKIKKLLDSAKSEE